MITKEQSLTSKMSLKQIFYPIIWKWIFIIHLSKQFKSLNKNYLHMILLQLQFYQTSIFQKQK